MTGTPSRQPPRVTIRELPPRRTSGGAARPAPGASVARPSSAAAGARSAARSVQHLATQERLSIGFAFEGLRYSWRTQRHLRMHASIAVLVVGVGLLLSLSAGEWAVLLAMMSLVGTLELLNTVVEVVVDLLSPDYHPRAKVAKDVAAGAVLLAAL